MNDTGVKAQNALRQDLQNRNAWRTTSIALVLAIASLIISFYPTVDSIVSIWLRSDTFAHGFIIIPISLWLIWQKRELLRRMLPSPTLLALVPLIGCGILWLLGYLVDVLVVQQAAFVLILIFTVWGVLGNQVSWKILFPLFFLLFMVPVGEDFIPPMMEITASSTVWLVRAIGIPVYREGLFFSLPSGNWSVVEACSGVRYLIASVVLGCLYAYLTYRTLWKRLVFVAISAAVPVAANSVRAFIIVMLGHFSGMKLAVGVDHLIYGWVFFGLVMLILFWVGGFFREDDTQAASAESGVADPDLRQGDFANKVIPKCRTMTKVRIQNVTKYIPIFIVALCWPILANTVFTSKQVENSPGLDIPAAPADWSLQANSLSEWQPIIRGATTSVQATYSTTSGKEVGLYVYHYLYQTQGAELINSRNLLAEDRGTWRIASRGSEILHLGDRSIKVDVAVIKGAGQELRIWSWYRIGNFYTANNYIAKLMEALNKLAGRRQDGARIFIVSENDASADADDKLLQHFTRQAIGNLENSLDRNAGI